MSDINTDHLGSAAAAFRATVVNEFTANDWDPDLASVVWDDTVTITSSAQLNSWFAGTAVGGVTINVARNQRVQLTVGGNFTSASHAQPALRGKDYVASGKVLLIEPQTSSPIITSRFRIAGARGVCVRNLVFAPSVTTSGGNLSWNPGLNSVTIPGGATGSGYAVGDVLVFAGSNVLVTPQAHVSAVDAGGAITAVVIDNPGCLKGSLTASQIGVTSVAGTGEVLTGSMGANPRDVQTIVVDRNATFPLLSLVIFDGCSIGAAFQSPAVTNPLEYLVGIQAQNIEQLTVRNCAFRGYQTAISVNTVRRFRRFSNEFQQGIGDATIVTSTAATSTSPGTAFSGTWPDKKCYTWSRLNLFRNAVDACATVNSAGEDMGLDQEHTDFLQFGTSGDTGDHEYVMEFDCEYGQRVTYRDRGSVRVAGGIQGNYDDDSTLSINGLVSSCLLGTFASATYTGWTGTVHVERCTAFRVAGLPPSATIMADGFAYDIDPVPAMLSRKKHGTTLAADHYVTGCIAGSIRTVSSGTAYAAGNLVQSGNVIANPRKGAAAGSRWQDVFAGSFSADAEGRTTYSFTDDGSASRSAFLSALWAIFAPQAGYSDKGALDPGTWPSS